jgi:hypothetical protein
MFQAGTKQRLAALKRAAMTASRPRQGLQVIKSFVSQRVRFQVTPDIFDRIQLRCIRREEVRSPCFLSGDVGLNDPRPMSLEPIPNQDHGPADMAAQLPEKR